MTGAMYINNVTQMPLDSSALAVTLTSCLAANLETWSTVELFSNIVVENDVVFVDALLIPRAFAEEVVRAFRYEPVTL